jgi:membrane dipeptidase
LETAVGEQAAEFHRQCTVADLHADTFLWKRLLGYDVARRHRSLVPGNPFFNHIDIPRAVEGGLNITGQGVVAHPWRASRCHERGIKMIDTILQGIDRNPDALQLALDARQAREAVAAGKIAVFIGVEGGHMLSGNLDAVKRFQRKGMRYLTLGHFSENEAVYCSNDRRNADRPLKPFGRELVRELERMKVMIDLAHVAPGCFRDVVEMAAGPVIVSHTGMRAVHDMWRNLDDEQSLAVARKGGVIGIIFASVYLTGHMFRCDLDAVVAHIEHALRVVGEDHVALGSDWDGFITPARGLETVTGLPSLTRRLLERGHGKPTLRKILGENVLRVFQQVCG